jgi:hypothetical protein
MSLVHISPLTVASSSMRLDGITAPLPNDKQHGHDQWYHQLEYWRLYLLYADGRLSCYTIQRQRDTSQQQ